MRRKSAREETREAKKGNANSMKMIGRIKESRGGGGYGGRG